VLIPLFSPFKRSVTYIPRQMSLRKATIRGFYGALTAKIAAKGPKEPVIKKQEAKYVSPAIASFAIRKGPYGAKWFSSFSNYAKARRVDLFLESSPSDKGKVAAAPIRPAIRWVGTKDGATKKRLADNFYDPPTLADFDNGAVKDSRPLYLSTRRRSRPAVTLRRS
jgi:hypothetical protein